MRTCLLCDKPLSRIWLGAGEDFCSREHRNQYRLRRGMDRLLEANKVASLMRRRESPKPLSPFREMDETGIPRRGFFESQSALPADRPMLPAVWEHAGLSSQALVLARGSGFVVGAANRRRQPVPSSHEAEAPRMTMRRKAPEIRTHRVRQAVHIAAAGPAQRSAKSCGALESGTRGCRNTTIVWTCSLHLHLDPRRVTPSAFHAFPEPHGGCTSNGAGPSGYSLRVSMGAGFRIQSTRLRSLRLELPQPQVPQERHELRFETRSPDGHPASRLAGGTAFPLATPGLPALDWDDPEVHMAWPGLLSLWESLDDISGPAPHRGPELEVRSHGEVQSALKAAFPPPIPHGGRDRALPRVRLLNPTGASPAPRAADVPIGCVADGVDSRPGAPPESRSSMEERFDSGWKNWTGGYANWTVDAAGARTGSLALFTPSLEWRDYELEFFTRIENRSVTWVYRAAGLNDYYTASLTALPGKGFAFTRRTVLRGKPGAASTAPLSILPNPKNAYLVRMRIAGTQFSVSIDGQLIESWTDNRLTAGGVGFIGAPEDRARIYWVRFYPGPAKEFPRK
jgi:hypothetical protein